MHGVEEARGIMLLIKGQPDRGSVGTNAQGKYQYERSYLAINELIVV